MDWDIYLRTLVALVAVLALITAVAWLVRRFGLGGMPMVARRRRRLSIVEVLPLDTRRRLILVRRDQREHLLLIGGGSDMVIEREGDGAAATAGPLPQEGGPDR